MPTPPLLGSILPPDKNSFNLIRLIAALCVVVSHCYALSFGASSAEPLAGVTPFTLGQHAVNAFFVISGLTLAASLDRNPDLLHFAWSRLLRLVPGLLTFGVLFAFVAGPVLTTLRLSDYFSESHTYTYPLAVLVQFSRAEPPREIFLNSPFAGSVNEPLWTIKYEIVAYASLAILTYLGMFRRTPVMILVLLGTLALLIATAPPPGHEASAGWLHNLGRYGFCFQLGVVAFHCRNGLSLSPTTLFVSGALLYALCDSIWREAAYIGFIANLALVVGALHFGPLTTFTQGSDLSYATYIYGWPIQQSIITLFPELGLPGLMIAALIVIPPVAMASWRLIERPALQWKNADLRGAVASLRVGLRSRRQGRIRRG